MSLALPDGFELLSVLAEGGMGVVFKARHLASDRVVALKTLKGPPDPRRAERFRHEARVLASLRHPSNVRVIAHGDDRRGQPFLAMELVPGESLAEAIAREGRMEPSRAIGLLVDVLSALEEAHLAGIVHRDVKPGNVLLRKGFQTGRGVGECPVVCDYGLAKLFASSEASEEPRAVAPGPTVPRARRPPVSDAQVARFTETQALVGTPLYMSPEQALGEPLDPRTDLYSAGAMLYELLAGRPAFDATSLPALLAQILEGARRPMPAGIDPALVALVGHAMEPDRERRIASAALFRARLEGIARRLAADARRRPQIRAEATAAYAPRTKYLLLLGVVGVLGFVAPRDCADDLPRWAHDRQVRKAEKRERFQRQLQRSTPSPGPNGR